MQAELPLKAVKTGDDGKLPSSNFWRRRRLLMERLSLTRSLYALAVERIARSSSFQRSLACYTATSSCNLFRRNLLEATASYIAGYNWLPFARTETGQAMQTSPVEPPDWLLSADPLFLILVLVLFIPFSFSFLFLFSMDKQMDGLALARARASQAKLMCSNFGPTFAAAAAQTDSSAIRNSNLRKRLVLRHSSARPSLHYSSTLLCSSTSRSSQH